MTIAKIRNIDLLIFTLIAVIMDFVIGRYGLFGLRMYFAISYPIIFLMYVRWRKWGLVVNAVIALFHIIIYWDNPPLVMLAHSLSIMGFAVMIYVAAVIREKAFRYEIVLVAFLLVSILVIMLEWVLLLVFNQGISIVNHLVNQSINLLLGLLILYIMHLQKDLITDMQTYFTEQKKGN